MNMHPKTEHEWRAESDANTLAEAKVIAQDTARLKAAQTAAARLADEQKAKAAAMQKVADNPKAAANPTSNYGRGPMAWPIPVTPRHGPGADKSR